MKKNFLFLMLMTLGLFISSCAKDDSLSGAVEVVMPDDVDLTSLDMWSYEIPFEVKSDGAWSVETIGSGFYVFPTEGDGDSTVTLCMIENYTDDRNVGTINIKNSDGIITEIEITQKCEADYDDNGIYNNTPSPLKYAVGYGYNTLGEYASPNSVKRQIVRWFEMDDLGYIDLNNSNAKFSEKTVTGSSLQDLSYNIKATSNLDVSYFGFAGEVSATFDTGSTQSEYNEYAISYIDYKVTDIMINANVTSIREKWLNDDAKVAIDGTSSYYAGDDGIRKLLSEYGTHLITKADLGGRLKFYMTIDVSKMTGYYDITAFAKASYSCVGTDVSASVDTNFKSSYETNMSNIETSFTAVGGSSATLINAYDKETNTFSSGAISAWKESVESGYSDVNTNATALVGFGSDSDGLIPIYELASDATRQAAIKAIMDNAEFGAVDYSDKTAYKISVPSFSTSSSATLVKDIKNSNNSIIATVCSEFIPAINPEERVTVVYPVIGGKVYMNAGFYIGGNDSYPKRVSWNGSDLTMIDYDQLERAEYKTLYIKGATILADYSEADSGAAVATTISNSYLVAGSESSTSHNYPLVKIFGNIWTREDYKPYSSGSGSSFSVEIPWGYNLGNNQGTTSAVHTTINVIASWNRCYYKPYLATESSFPPTGWDVPNSSDYTDIKNMLTKYSINVGPAFRSGKGVPLGYDAPVGDNDGWYRITSGAKTIYNSSLYAYLVEFNGSGDQNEYLTQDMHHVRMNDSGFEETEAISNGYFMTVRLIKEN